MTAIEYDRIADVYDGLFSDVESMKENIHITETAPNSGRLLDIGCGTGLFLDYADVSPSRYIGIDPSAKMLARFRAKHPTHTALRTSFEDFNPQGRFNTILSLFGSPSYIEPQSLSRIQGMLSHGGKYFLMFYRPGYFPETYRRTGITPEHYPLDTRMFPDADMKLYHNFVLVTNENLS